MTNTILFDVDGTLVDSNDAHARAWEDVFREEGYAARFADVRPLIGMGGDKLLPKVIGVDAESERGKELGERRKAIFKERYLPTLRPFPGARALLERLRAEGRTLVVATSAQEDELAGLLDAAGVADMFAETTSSSDASNSKPDPDIIQAALARAGGTAPADALMVGDTPYDVEAAARAGVRTVAVRSGGWDDVALRGALAVFADVGDILARFDASPFARA
ncbi:MAG TPA: HAD family hydrolase [Gemmatimonadaceae bacterium]|nr:HAD family hydrolase [Gemmatimonadaceae bacterium]